MNMCICVCIYIYIYICVYIYIYIYMTEGCDFIEFEISNSTDSTCTGTCVKDRGYGFIEFEEILTFVYPAYVSRSCHEVRV